LEESSTSPSPSSRPPAAADNNNFTNCSLKLFYELSLVPIVLCNDKLCDGSDDGRLVGVVTAAAKNTKKRQMK